MGIFKRKKKTENIDVDDVISFINQHKKLLSKKCRQAYDDGDISSGRWWDCQACAMLTLMDKFKNEFKQ